MLLSTYLSLLYYIILGRDIIQLQQGYLEGHRLTTRKGREIFAFQGIPYAEPPVGELRFKPPQSPKPWKGILNATKEGSDCVQRSIFNPDAPIQGQEDCLYLNVYTPQKPGFARNELLDVMFWIHGGGLVSGSGSSFMYGPQFLLDKDIVLVTINYRLGAIGFLSTGDSECPGNNGLKDQVAALHWVKNNIAAFGGNPNSVTIFGESAGGSSVHFHMLAPASRGLFHRGISQSGTALAVWASALNGSTVHYTTKLASLVGCPDKPSNTLLSCLRNKDAYDLAAIDMKFMEWDVYPLSPFNVVVESDVGENNEAFLTMMPEDAVLHACSEHLVPWLVGLNSDDGAIVTARFFSNDSFIEQLNERFAEIIPIVLYIREIVLPTDLANVTEQIRKFYLQDDLISWNTSSNVSNMITDDFFFIGANQAVKLHSQKPSPAPPVYYYLFDYRGTHSYSSFFGDLTHDYGVTHQDDMLYLFPQDHLFPGGGRSKNDDKMVEILTTLWTNFAHAGNPTYKTKSLQTWYPVSTPDNEYAHIKIDGLHMEENLWKERADFWASIFNKEK